MADTALKFGPEWLRALTEPQGGPGVVQYTPPLPNMKLAEFRYGREEMLALFDKTIKPPEDLSQFGSLFVEKCQFPYNLMQMSDEESRAWQRGANSDASLRPYGPPGKRPPSPTGLRDRGRGRGRGTFYDRNRSMDDDMDGLRGREREGPSVDRGFGTGRGGMRGGFDRQTSERGWFDRGDRSLNLEDPTGGVSPRKGYTRAPFDDWRRNGPGGEVDAAVEGEGWRGAGHRTADPGEGEGWRTTGPRRWTGAGSQEQRGGWRSSAATDRERDSGYGRSKFGETGRGGDRWRKEGEDGRGQAVTRPGFGRQKSAYDKDLPEWAVDDTSGEGGSFDDSGKFRAEQSRQSGGVGAEDWGDGEQRWDEEEVDPDDVQQANTGQQMDQKSNSRDNNGSESRPEPRDESNVSSADRTSSTWDSEPSPSHGRPDSSAVSPHSSPPSSHGAPIHSTPGDSVPPQDRRRVSGHSPALSPPTGPPDESRRSVPRNDHMDALTGNMVNSLVDDEEPQERPNSGSFQHSSQPPTPGVGPGAPGLGNGTPGATPPLSLPPPPPTTWSYLDPQGQQQGPFQAEEMLEWYNAGYFPHDLMVRRSIDTKFTSLTEMSKLFGRVPFTPGTAPGPILEPDPEEERKKQALLVQQIQQQLLVQQQLLHHAHQQQMLSMQQQGLPQGLPFQGLGNMGGLPGLGGLPDPSRGFPSPDPIRSILSGIPPLSADPTDPLKQLLARTQQQPPMPGLTRPLTTSHPSSLQRAAPVTAPSEAMPWDSRLPDLRHPVTSHDPRMSVPEPKPEQSRQFDPIQSLLQQLHGSGGGQPLPNNQHLSGPPPSHHHEQRSHHLSGGPSSHPDSPQFPRAAGQSPFTDSTSSQFDQIHTVPENSQSKPSEGAAPFGKSDPPRTQLNPTDLPQYTSQSQPIKSIWDLPEPEPLSNNIQNQQQTVQKPIQSIWNDSPLPERKAPITPEPTEPRSVTPSPVPEPPSETTAWNDSMQEEDSTQDDTASFVKPNKNEKKDKKSKKAEEKRKTKEAKRQAEPKSYIPGMSTVKPEEPVIATQNIVDHREEEKIREQQEALAQQRAQMEALQKLQDDQKAKLEREDQLRMQREIAEKMNKPAPWAKTEKSPAREPNEGLTLAEIQKMEAERDRKEREAREAAEAVQREEQRRLEAEERARRAAKTINWATVSGGGSGVKSLAEIQAEEARVERERQEKEQRERAARQKEMNLAQAGVWGNASNNLSWAGKMGAGQSNGPQQPRANGNPWGNTSSTAATVAPEGFWDPVVPGDDPPLMSVVQRTTPTSSNNNKKKSKKVNEEAKVKEIFKENKSKPKNEFEEWCTKAIGSLNAQGLDIPTFLTFLMDIESPYEVHDYVKSYIGEGKAPKRFAIEYLERRSRWKNSLKNQGKYYDDDLLTPAIAINPLDGEFVEAGKKGKKAARSKTTSKSKLDMSHLLGFSVAGQGVNRGELDLPQ